NDMPSKLYTRCTSRVIFARRAVAQPLPVTFDRPPLYIDRGDPVDHSTFSARPSVRCTACGPTGQPIAWQTRPLLAWRGVRRRSARRAVGHRGDRRRALSHHYQQRAAAFLLGLRGQVRLSLASETRGAGARTMSTPPIGE